MLQKTPAGRELQNLTPQPKEGYIVNAVLKAARRLTHQQVDAVLNGDLEKLWELMTTPAWIKPYIPHLRAELKKRLDANPGIDLETAIADLDINFELEPGYIVVVDLNYYSNFQKRATDHQKAILDKSYQKRMFELSDKFGVKMLQAPAGDAFIFHIEEDPAKLAEFLAELKNSKINNPLKNADAAMYPDGNFTFSTGVAKNRAGELNMSLYTTAANLDHGLIDVGGAAFVRAIKLQQSVGKNQIGIDDETATDLRKPETITEKKEKTVQNLPKDDKEAVALMAALAKASHPRGSISTINRDLIEDLPNLGGITTIAIYAGNLEEIGKNPEAYKNISKKLLALRERFPNFFMFKKDEAKFHIHTNTELNEAGGKLIIDFCAEAARVVREAGLTCGIGVGYTETMVRTRILNSSIEERAGTGIVKAVRLATVPEKALRLDGEFCKAAFGNIFELESVKIDDVKAKGGDIPCVTLPPDDINFDKLEGKILVGVEKEIERINKFIDNSGKNGAALKIYSAGTGFGVSALIRHAIRYAKKNGISVLDLESCALNLSDEDFEKLLLNGEFWMKRHILTLDKKNLNDNEKNRLEKLLAILAGANTSMIHSGDFDSELSDEMEIKEFNPERAADLILKMEGKLNPTILRDPIISALKKVFMEEGHLPFTPRNIIRNYAEAMEINNDIVSFNPDKLGQVQTGELTQKIKELDISEERILLLGIIAYINIPLDADSLWSIYSRKGQKDRTRFNEDLQYLCERGFIDLNAGEYSLKDRNEKNSAISLAKSQIEESDLSGAILAFGAFPASIAGMEAELEHLLKAEGANNLRLIENIIRNIGSHYFKNGNLSAARGVYAKYIPFIENSGNSDLLLEIAWAFHNGDKNQMRIAEEICAKSGTIRAKWILSRLVKVKIGSNIGDELRARVKTDMTGAEMDACFEQGLLQDELKKISDDIQKDDSDEAKLMKVELKIEDLYQRIKTYRFFRYEKKDADWLKQKNAELKAMLEQLIEELPAEGNKEMICAAKIVIASSHNELLERAKAKAAFREAEAALNNLEISDYKQKIICLMGEVLPWDFLLQKKIDDEQRPNEEWRMQIDGEIDEFEARIKFLEELCILYGDSHYRAETYQFYADATELRMRAVAKFPMPADDRFHAQQKFNEACENVDRFINTRSIIGNPPYPGWEAEAKQMLNGVFSTLPDRVK